MDQDQALDPEDLLTSVRSFLSDDRPQRFLVGFFFAMAFFLIEAGVAEVLLARNEVCLQTLSGFRLAPDPNQICMSEFEFFFARSLSQGAIGSLSPGTSPFIAWPIMAVLYGLIGGGFAQLSLRAAIAGFLIVHVILLMGFMSIDYISQFIVFN